MQIVSWGDDLHEMSVYFLGKVRKIVQMSSAENFTQNAKRKDICICAP